MTWGRRKTKAQRRNAAEEREAIYIRDHMTCRTCGQLVAWDQFQLAHRIADTVANRIRYGAEIVDHPLNRVVTHPGACNDAQNIGFNPVACAELIDQIKEVVR